jgi:integrase/recombinase XerD
MSDLHAALRDYLAIRRKLGFSLTRDGHLLPDFVSYLEGAGADRITTVLALAWATQPLGAHPHWWRQRLSLVRGFARHLKAIDSLNEIPPQDLLPSHRPRITPYLYSDEAIEGLLAAAKVLSPSFRAVTYGAFVGLMIVSGLRVGEAIGLDRADVDLDGGFVVVRRAKFHKSREVCLHESTIRALSAYAGIREQHYPIAVTPSFFVSTRGGRLTIGAVQYTFRQLVRHAQLEGRGARCRPRLHDFRHSFAVHTLMDWYRSGKDAEAQLPLLSSYLGHTNPSSTYWYLEAAPELFAIVGKRLDDVLGELP